MRLGCRGTCSYISYPRSHCGAADSSSSQSAERKESFPGGSTGAESRRRVLLPGSAKALPRARCAVSLNETQVKKSKKSANVPILRCLVRHFLQPSSCHSAGEKHQGHGTKPHCFSPLLSDLSSIPSLWPSSCGLAWDSSAPFSTWANCCCKTSFLIFCQHFYWQIQISVF